MSFIPQNFQNKLCWRKTKELFWHLKGWDWAPWRYIGFLCVLVHVLQAIEVRCQKSTLSLLHEDIFSQFFHLYCCSSSICKEGSQGAGTAVLVRPHLTALAPALRKRELLWQSTKKAGICNISPAQTLLASNSSQLGKFPMPAGICLLGNYQFIFWMLLGPLFAKCHPGCPKANNFIGLAQPELPACF